MDYPYTTSPSNAHDIELQGYANGQPNYGYDYQEEEEEEYPQQEGKAESFSSISISVLSLSINDKFETISSVCLRD